MYRDCLHIGRDEEYGLKTVDLNKTTDNLNTTTETEESSLSSLESDLT